MEAETYEKLADIWKTLERLRAELCRSGPDTIQAERRAVEISGSIERLEARYRELGGILYDFMPPDEDD